MSSKYVPPAMRKKEHPAVAPPPPPPEKKYEDEFPSLGQIPTTRRVWGGTSTFAEKAREWSAHSEKEAQELEARKKVEIVMQPRMSMRPLPRFQNIRRFVEDHEPEKQETTNPEDGEDEESGWTLVEKKARKKQKSLTEIADEDLEKGSEEENGESVWNNDEKELHETCWDERA